MNVEPVFIFGTPDDLLRLAALLGELGVELVYHREDELTPPLLELQSTTGGWVAFTLDAGSWSDYQSQMFDDDVLNSEISGFFDQ